MEWNVARFRHISQITENNVDCACLYLIHHDDKFIVNVVRYSSESFD